MCFQKAGGSINPAYWRFWDRGTITVLVISIISIVVASIVYVVVE